MTEQTLKNVIRKTMFHAEGMISYAYQGGEPTLRGIAFYEKRWNIKDITISAEYV